MNENVCIYVYRVPSEYRFFAGVVTATVDDVDDADDELEALVGVCLACLAGVGAILMLGGDAMFMRRFVA